MHQPTALHDIRSFLATHGQVVPAWSPADEPLQALYSLLQQRRHDDAFWRDAAGLARRIESTRIRPATVSGLEAIAGGDLDKLIADLRASVPETADAPRSMRSWAATLNATALAGFVLLGAAVGCDGPLAGGNGNAQCDEAAEYDIDADEQDVFCELMSIVDDSAHDDWVVDTLRECLPDLGSDVRDELLDAFLDASDDELANILEGLALSPECDDDWDDNYNDH
jgi:hypothetical protein